MVVAGPRQRQGSPVRVRPSARRSTAFVNISNTFTSDSGGHGIYISNFGSPSGIQVSIDNVSVNGNVFDGISAQRTAKVLLSRSFITGNTTGISNGTSPNTVYTYKDNRINLNSTDFAGTLNTAFATQ